MKQLLGGAYLKKTFIVVLLACLFSPLLSKAAEEVDSTARKQKGCYVEYVSADTGSLWFTIKYANPGGGPFSLVIKNSDGDVLFRGAFSGVNFSRKIKLLPDERDTIPCFVIKSGTELITQSFRVNGMPKLAEDPVMVTRL